MRAQFETPGSHRERGFLKQVLEEPRFEEDSNVIVLVEAN